MTPLSATPLIPEISGAGGRKSTAAPASPLEELVRSALRLRSLSAKYEHHAARGVLALKDLPVLTREELATATREALVLRGGGPGLLYAHGGSLEAPDLSLLPEGLSASEIHAAWNPLGPQDVMANLHPTGRHSPDHDLFNRLAAASGATVLPVGALPEGDVDRWLTFFAAHGVTALAAPPDAVPGLLGGVDAGRPLPWLRTLLLGGAAHDGTPASLLAARLPYTDIWRLHGTPAAWVIGHHGPHCLADVYHPLPHQMVEVVDGRLLVTTLGADRFPPLIRYATQERGEYTHCVCDDRGPAIRVCDAASPSFRFRGGTVDAAELVTLATACEEVDGAQVAVSPDQRIQLRVRLTPGTVDDHHTRAWIRFRVLEHHLFLSGFAGDQSDAFDLVTVDRLPDTSPLTPGLF